MEVACINFIQPPCLKLHLSIFYKILCQRIQKITGSAEFSFPLVVQCTASDYIEYCPNCVLKKKKINSLWTSGDTYHYSIPHKYISMS